MHYMLLIYGREADRADRSEEEMQGVMRDYYAFTSAIKKSGHYRAGDALHPVGTATTVQMRNGKRLVTDGPFAETREQLGGYYLVEADDLDTAVEIASRIPDARYGSIEVRPVWEIPQE